MGKYIIRYGLGGGFGGIKDEEKIECKSLEEAEHEAWLKACEEYDNYDGLHGLRSIDDIMEDEGVDENEAEEIWREEREDWLVYEVEEIK